MDPDCWFCGRPIREGEPAESLPPSTLAVHAICVERDVTGGNDGTSVVGGWKAAA